MRPDFRDKGNELHPITIWKGLSMPAMQSVASYRRKGKSPFFVMTYGITLPLGVATLVLLNQSRLFELAFFQRQGWHWFGPTLLIVILGTIGLAGAWCGALASSKVTKLKRVQVALDRVGRH